MKFTYKAAVVDDCLCEKEMRKGKIRRKKKHSYSILFAWKSSLNMYCVRRKKGIQCHFHNYKKFLFRNLWNEREMVVDECEEKNCMDKFICRELWIVVDFTDAFLCCWGFGNSKFWLFLNSSNSLRVKFAQSIGFLIPKNSF